MPTPDKTTEPKFCDKHWCETNHNALEQALSLQRNRIIEECEKSKIPEDIKEALGKYAGFANAIDDGEAHKTRVMHHNSALQQIIDKIKSIWPSS